MKKYKRFVYGFVLISVIFGTMFAVIQQQNRRQANDLPLAMATEAASQLEAGLKLSGLDVGKVDVRTTLMPFLTVYDKKGTVVAGSGWLSGKVAEMPAGVVQHATPGKNHYVTWAPASGLRFATATVATKNYYVVGAQSLSSAEQRTEQLGWLVVYGYVIAVAVLIGRHIFGGVRACGCACCSGMAMQTVRPTAKKSSRKNKRRQAAGL